MEKPYKTPTIIAIISVIMGFILLFDQQLEIGYWLSYIFPCETPIGNSFPCYGKYSIYLFLIFIVIFISSILYLLQLKKQKQGNIIIYPSKIIFNILLTWILGGVIVFLIALTYSWFIAFFLN